MRKFLGLALLAALLSTTPLLAAPGETAHANLIDKQGDPVGVATLEETVNGVQVHVTVHDLPTGMHGIHIHDVGKADPPDFTTAGPHFNPDSHHHGLDNLSGHHHMGDMPNLTVDSTGHGELTFTLDSATLAPGPHSLFHPGGTAIVIHEKGDDEVTDPTGNSGGRIAAGVIVH